MSTKTQRPFQALLEVQRTLGPTSPKLKSNPAFKNARFIPLPDLMEIVHPVLTEAGIILTQGGCRAPVGYIGILTRLVHAETGETLAESRLQLPHRPEDPQKGTAALTYGRRTSICAILGIAEADDDGNTAAKEDAPKPRSSGGKIDRNLF